MTVTLGHSDLWADFWILGLVLASLFCTQHLILRKFDKLSKPNHERQVHQCKLLPKCRTVRINEIPIGTTKKSMLDELKTLVRDDSELDTMLNSAHESRCTLARRNRQHACSTLEIHSHLSPEEIVQRFNRQLGRTRFRFDCHFRGITPLFEDDDDAAVDVIAVPGLASHPIGSWSLSDGSGDFWLRDFLPDDLPNARVLIYGYDSKLDDTRSTENIQTMGSAFLHTLNAFRTSTQTVNRPIIFVAHSLGGLLLKEALLKAHDKQESDDGCRGIAEGCYALLMFGVPNLGLRNREQLQTIVQGQANESLINDVVVDRSGQPQAYLRGLREHFATRCEERYKVVCFYETKYSPTVQIHPHQNFYLRFLKRNRRRLAKTGPEMLLVSMESATDVGLTTTRHQFNVNLQKDHSGLCKLERADYEIVLDRLRPLVEEASSGTPTLMLERGGKDHLDNLRRAILTPVTPLYTQISKRFPDTKWLLDNDDYCHWIDSKPLSSDCQGTITLRGGLGSGKTVLMERSFQEAVQSNSSVKVWHCFDSSKGQGSSSLTNSSRGLCLSLFAQLLDQVKKKPWQEIRQLGQDLESIPDKHFESLISDLLISNKTTVGKQPVTFRFFIDALEQCSSTDPEMGSSLTHVNAEMKKILRFLTDLIALRETDGVDLRICVSRRHAPTFGHLEPSATVIILEDYIGPLVGAFMKNELARLPDETLFHFFYPRLKGRVLNGYLWASFVLERIKADASLLRDSDRIELLNGIPDKMEKMYEYVFDTLDKSSNPQATRLLQIVLVAAEPMTIHQLRHALRFTEAFPFSSINEWERLGSKGSVGDNFPTHLRELTHGLLTSSLPPVSSSFMEHERFSIRPMPVPGDVSVVSFAHSTTEGFLREAAKKGSNTLAKELVDTKSHLTLLMACFRALEIFGSEQDSEDFTFINYACEFWLHHAREADDHLITMDRGIIPDFILQCDSVTTLLLDRQMTLLQRSHAKEHVVLEQPEAGFMVYAATFGCTKLLRMHQEECRRCTDLTTPQVQMMLSTALRNSITCRWPETTQYLLSVYCGATGSLENDGFLLYKACYAGDIKTVEFLLKNGANPSITHFRGYILPLHAAIIKGRADIVALLLDTSVADAQSLLTQKGIEIGTTALHLVLNMQRSSYDKVAVLKTLLKHVPRGSEVLDIRDGNGNTPISLVRRMVASGQEGSWRLGASLLDKVRLDS